METLEETKKRLAQGFIGLEGIHGIGLRRSESAICVYHTPGFFAGQAGLLERLRREADPYKIVVIEEEAPTFKT
jgi:hypothetical protein